MSKVGRYCLLWANRAAPVLVESGRAVDRLQSSLALSEFDTGLCHSTGNIIGAGLVLMGGLYGGLSAVRRTPVLAEPSAEKCW